MKKYISILATMLFLCSCSANTYTSEETNSQTESTRTQITEQTTSTSSVTTLTETAETTAVTAEEKKYLNYRYDSDNPILKTLFELCEKTDGKGIIQYDFFDRDNDFSLELYVIAPCINDTEKNSFYIIDKDGSYICSSPFSADIACLYLTSKSMQADADIYMMTNDSNYIIFSANGEYLSTEKQSYVTAKNPYEIDMIYTAELSSDEFTGIVTEKCSKTPLELAQEYYDTEYNNDSNNGYACLVDVTEDGFPEILTVCHEGYINDSTYFVNDISRGKPVLLGSGCINFGDSITFFDSPDKGKGLISYYNIYCALHYSIRTFDCEYFNDLSASRFSENGFIESYWNWDAENMFTEYYVGECSLDGKKYDRTEINSRVSISFDEEDKWLNEMTEQMYSDFLSDKRVYLTATVSDREIVFSQQQSDFNDYPASAYLPDDTEHIKIGNEIYSITDNTILIATDELANNFDFDILNRFENLKEVRIDGSKKVHITPSEWCERITTLTINSSVAEIEGGYGCFSNVREFVAINGDLNYNISKPTALYELDFITDMQSIEIFSCEYAPDYDYLRPLMELKNLRVISDSGHGSFLDDEARKNPVPDDMADTVRKWIWTYIKIG